MLRNISLIFLWGLLFCWDSDAQIEFTKASEATIDLSDTYSGLPLVATDLNGDLLDDIIFLQDGNKVRIALQKPTGGFVLKQIVTLGGESKWSLVAADFNGNGSSEIVVGGSTGARIIFLDDRLNLDHREPLPGTSFFVQSMSAGDFNKDGWVDLFLCNDSGTSKILVNAFGSLVSRSPSWIDFNTVPPSDNSGNYGSVWTDFDRDGDMDLYLAKCKPGITDSTDPRRVNELYEHIGDSTYLERSALYGLDLGAQSWTADFGDLDGDRDMDALVTHHDVPSQILINEGGQYVDRTEEFGLGNPNFPLQAILADFDNDLHLDILITGQEHALYRNNGNGELTEQMFGDGEYISSFAAGDLNNDGRLDLYTSQTEIFQNPSLITDDLWFNVSEERHWIRLHLESRNGNRDAIGTGVELFGAFGAIYREVRAGESYGINHSTTLQFGLGNHTEVDSMRIRWPDGESEVHYNVSADSIYYLSRGHCLSSPIRLMGMDDLSLCPGDSVQLTAPQGEDYQWNTGETSRSITVREFGLYHVSFTNNSACRQIAGPILLRNPLDIAPVIRYDGMRSRCLSDSFSLQAGPEFQNIIWSDGSSAQHLSPGQSGWYYYDVMTACGSVRSDSVFLNLYRAPAPHIVNDTLAEAGPAQLFAEGGEVSWFYDSTDQQEFFRGTVLQIDHVGRDTTFYVESQYHYPGEEYRVGEEEHRGSKHHNPDYAGHMEFTVNSPVQIDSVKVYTDHAAARVLQIERMSGSIVYRDTMYIDSGKQTLSLGPILDPGNYIISTDESFNQEMFGSISPRLYRTEGGTDYPYEIDDLLSIETSSLGTNYYYYFYDWTVSTPDVECTSERVPVSVIVGRDTMTGTEWFPVTSALMLFPNPAVESVQITWDKSVQDCGGIHQVRLIDWAGRIRLSTTWQRKQDGEISLENLPAGVYMLIVSCQNGLEFVRPLVIVKD